MSLIGFHKVLIGTAVLFCASFAAWQGMRVPEEGMAALVATLGFGLAAVALLVYLWRLDRILGRNPDR